MASLANRRVLIVDDEAEVCRSIADWLRGAGCRTAVCRRGFLVPRAVLRWRPDVVVLDAHLGGGLSGFALCSILTGEARTRGVRVLMMSGAQAPKDLAERMRLCGARGFLAKPFDLEVLRRRLEDLLASPSHNDVAVPIAGPRHGGTLLVADDDAEWRDLLRASLSKAGYRVVTTGDASAVARLALQHLPDGIVLDHDMGKAQAPEVLRRLQEEVATRGIPVVLLTSHEKVRVPILGAGADYFVSKQAPSEELLLAIEAAVRRRLWSSGVVIRGDLRLDLASRALYLKDLFVAVLPEGPFALLRALVEISPRGLSHDEISRRFLKSGLPSGESKAVDKLVSRLKEKAGPELAARVHHLPQIGWFYEEPPFPPGVQSRPLKK